MTFDNHPPVSFDKAKEIACAATDGGAYSGIGHNRYLVMQGNKFHITHSYSSGCVGHGQHSAPTSTEYLGCYDTKEEVIAHLVSQESSWWVNALLSDLGYKGVEA